MNTMYFIWIKIKNKLYHLFFLIYCLKHGNKDIWPKCPPWDNFVAKMSKVEMSRPKCPRPKHPWLNHLSTISHTPTHMHTHTHTPRNFLCMPLTTCFGEGGYAQPSCTCVSNFSCSNCWCHVWNQVERASMFPVVVSPYPMCTIMEECETYAVLWLRTSDMGKAPWVNRSPGLHTTQEHKATKSQQKMLWLRITKTNFV